MSSERRSAAAATLERLLREHAGLARIRDVVAAAASNDGAHDLGHVMRVTLTALEIAEDGVAEDEIVAAGLLHDLVNVPKNAPERALASERSAERAAGLLRECGFSDRAMQRIVDAIRDHSYSRGATPTEPLGRALQDADRLDALGAIGVLRAASTGERMGTSYYDARDPWAERRELDDRSFTIDHFFSKLLLLPSRMNTDRGRAEAERRAAFMKEFLDQLGREVGEVRPGGKT